MRLADTLNIAKLHFLYHNQKILIVVVVLGFTIAICKVTSDVECFAWAALYGII